MQTQTRKYTYELPQTQTRKYTYELPQTVSDLSIFSLALLQNF